MRWIAPADLYVLAAIGLIQLARATSSARLHARIVSGVAYRVSARKRRRIEAALARVFSASLTGPERRAVARQSFLTHWQDTFACPPLPAGDDALATAETTGLPRIHDALAAGKGVILIESSAFGHRAMAKQILHRHGLAVHTVHVERHTWGLGEQAPSRLQRRVTRPYFERRELSYVAEITYLPDSEAMSYTRHLVRRLATNGIVCLSGDGQTGKKHVSVDFLGRPKLFTTGVVSLARMSGAPALPIFCVLEPGDRYRLVVEPPLELAPGAPREDSLAGGVTQYARLLEGYIRSHPGQYKNWR
jgi:lauroyl/myristoyl acyltransferase